MFSSQSKASFFSVDSTKLTSSPNSFYSTPASVSIQVQPFLGSSSTFLPLSFSKHVSSLKAKFFPRIKALRCISASSGGPSKESLSLLNKAFLRSLLIYASQDGFLSQTLLISHRRDGVVVRAYASQSVDLGFISLVESYQKTLKNGIHSFPAWRSAHKG